jgi:FkbH-like protein
MLKFLLRYGWRFATSSAYRNYVLQLLAQRSAPALTAERFVRARYNDFADLRHCKAFLCGGCELSFIADHLRTVGLDVYHTFDQGRTADPYVEVHDSDSRLYRESPDFVVLCQTQAFLGIARKAQREGTKYRGEDRLRDCDVLGEQLDVAIEKLGSLVDCPVFLLSHFYIGTRYRGSHEYKSQIGPASYEELNLSYLLNLYRLAKKHKHAYVLDVNEVLELDGKRTTLDAEMRSGHFDHPTKLGSRLLAEEVLYQFKVLNPKSKRVKCAVFDLDNTLWSGILREDGPGHLYPKWAHLQVLEALEARGILVAVCSKNDPEDAAHLESILGKEVADKFVSVKMNWGPKSQNIRQIAAELNLGLDAVAFFDDNPLEREEVRSNAPGVVVFDAAEILHVYHMAIFEPIGELTEESTTRTQLYKSQARRTAAESHFQGADLAEFYKSCQFQLHIARPGPGMAARIEELIQRTNQLNATGNRTARLVLDQFLNDDAHYHVCIASLRDRFGDYGLIGMCIAEKHGARWDVKELNFSCRAMGKHVEHAVMAHLRDCARQAGADQITVTMQKTSRNREMRRILEEVGFIPLQESEAAAELTLAVDQQAAQYPEWLQLVS